MPSVTFDGQSLSVKGRRIWLSATEFDYALTPPECWADRLRAASQAGFNTIVSACPWSLHEPRAGRIRCDGAFDVRRFAELCAEQGLWLVLRIGPVVGGRFEGGGLPGWLSDLPGIRLREANPTFFERVTRWYRAVAEQVVGLQATEPATKAARASRPSAETGPIIAVQLEDDWRSGLEDKTKLYLSELVRFAREVGWSVPLLTANESFAMVESAVDTLTVRGEALALMRQLAALNPGWPRLATVVAEDGDSLTLLRRTALTLAGGGQFVVRDAFACAGRSGAMFDASGYGVAAGAALKRIVRLASSFGHVFSQADLTRQAIVADPEHDQRTAVIPLVGSGGSATFVFRSGKCKPTETATLLLPDGRRLTALLGSQPVSWYLIDVDLGGVGVLDYSTAIPFALVDSRIVAFIGPAGADVEVSIDGSPVPMRVPSAAAGSKPAIEKVKDIVIVLCNEAQADATALLDEALVIGASVVRADGRVELATGFKAATRVTRSGTLQAVPKDLVESHRSSGASVAVAVGDWTTIAMQDLIDGTSQRFATLAGPASFAACGARDGYGWYRATFKRSSAAKVTLHAPQLADRVTLWLDGERIGTFGRGADPFPIEAKMPAGQHSLVLLVEAGDRPVRGDHVGRRTGLYGPVVEISSVKEQVQIERGIRADAFALGFVYEKHRGDVNGGPAFTWKRTQKKLTPLLLDLVGESREACRGATITVNGVTVARWSADGPEGVAVAIDPASTPALKVGANEFRFVLDDDMDDKDAARFAKDLRMYEVAQPIGGSAQWAFASWTPPSVWDSKPAKQQPSWSRGTCSLKDARRDGWLEVSCVGKGRAFVNGRSVGGCAARDPKVKTTDGASELFVPAQLLVAGVNEILLFDELGAPPKGVSLRFDPS